MSYYAGSGNIAWLGIQTGSELGCCVVKSKMLNLNFSLFMCLRKIVGISLYISKLQDKGIFGLGDPASPVALPVGTSGLSTNFQLPNIL